LLTLKKGTAAEQDFDLSLALSGVSWQDKTALFPGWENSDIESADAKKARQILYPWNWEYPTKIRIYWMINEKEGEEDSKYVCLKDTGKPLFTEIGLAPPAIDNEFDKDIANLKVFYTAVFNNKLWPKIKSNPRLFDPLQVFWDAKKQDVEISDTEASASPVNSGFLKAAVGNYAQKCAPLNQYISLVFLDKNKIKIPVNATYFAAFPVGGSWWKIDESYKVTDPALNESFLGLQYIPDLLTDPHKKTMMASAAITPLFEKEKYENNPVQLRKDMNFLGHADLRVNDVEDQMPEILKALGQFFDLPAKLHNYINKNKEDIKWRSGGNYTAYIEWLRKLENFLWSCTRDAMGFGSRENIRMLNTLQMLVKMYVDEVRGEVHTLDKEKQLQYWSDYNKMLAELSKTVHTEDKTYTAEKFKKIFQDNFKEALGEKMVLLHLQLFIGTDIPKENEINAGIDAWLKNWDSFLRLLKDDHAIIENIIYAQWEPVVIPYLKDNEGKTVTIESLGSLRN
jgi:hypothetical protein